MCEQSFCIQFIGPYFFNKITLKKEEITRQKIFLAALSGLLLTLSFPKTGFFWLSWFALVPLLVAVSNLSARNGFYLGFCAGLTHYLTLIYWLAHTMKTYGHLPLFLCLAVLFLFSAYLALYIAAFSLTVSRLCTTPVLCLVLVPCLWVLLEYVRSFLFTGFPWELIGYTQFQVLPIIQLSDIFGVYGVSFCIVLGNASILLLVLFLTGKRWQSKKVAKNLVTGSLATFILIFGLVWLYGTWRIRSIDDIASASPSARITIVQGNIAQSIKWDPAFQHDSTLKYIELSLRAKHLKPDLVVWPETATPFYFLHNTTLSQMVQQGIRNSGADFLIGSPSFRSANNRIEYYNSAYLIDAKGNVNGRYDKAHLVPFGEYIPFKDWLPFVGKIVEGVGDFRPGNEGSTISWRNFNLGVQICYEIIFPSLSRRMVNNDAALLVNITNDAWYGRSGAPYQHFSMAIFRAVENRRSLIRSANTGISGFIDPAGRVVAATALFEDATLTQTVPLLDEKTCYTRFGDLFVMVCLIATVAAALIPFLRPLNLKRGRTG